jgi:hypothetical protein
MSMKNSNYLIGNRTRDLLSCIAVPQPTALPRVHRVWMGYLIKMQKHTMHSEAETSYF